MEPEIKHTLTTLIELAGKQADEIACLKMVIFALLSTADDKLTNAVRDQMLVIINSDASAFAKDVAKSFLRLLAGCTPGDQA